LIIVPVLAFTFAAAGFPAAHVMQMALGTSLATIIFTSVSSTHAHHHRGGVSWTLVQRIIPGVIIGTLLGACLVSQMSTFWLKGIFVIFEFYVGTQMLLEFCPNPSGRHPSDTVMLFAGTLIGCLSSLVGIGGGTLSVPFLLCCNYPMRQAIGTSSAIGLPIAISASAGYIFAGQRIPDLPSLSAGFIYLPALAGIALSSVITAPFGAWLTHRLPVNILRKLFALLLYAVSARMAWSLM
ncbi:MAG: sulfite exporter TauE/SafE family protein, partial [Nitrosomonadales bacterium]